MPDYTVDWKRTLHTANVVVGENRNGAPLYVHLVIYHDDRTQYGWSVSGTGLSACPHCGNDRYLHNLVSAEDLARNTGTCPDLAAAKREAEDAIAMLAPLVLKAETLDLEKVSDGG